MFTGYSMEREAGRGASKKGLVAPDSEEEECPDDWAMAVRRAGGSKRDRG
jgi:hypothetical protein